MKINGETLYLWGAVEHEGEVVEVSATKHQDRRATQKFLKCVLKRYGCPYSIMTDRLRSYRATMNVIGMWPFRNADGRSTTEPKTHISPSGDVALRRAERGQTVQPSFDDTFHHGAEA